MTAPASERLEASPREGWQPFIYWKVIHAPATFGVCVIANSHREPILVAHGVLRTELWRLLNDPAAEKHDAYYFRAYPAAEEEDARRKAEDLVRDLVRSGSKPHVGAFPG